MLIHSLYLLSFLCLANLTAGSAYYFAKKTYTTTPPAKNVTQKVSENRRSIETKDCHLVPQTWIAEFRPCTSTRRSQDGK
jgi:hypothetical protein